jgi:hypothetical protein
MRCIRPKFLRSIISFPVRLVSRRLSSTLSKRLLLALEVAIEYWLALAFRIESKSVTDDSKDGSQEAHVQQQLWAEMEDQRNEVWQFIIDRCAAARACTCSSGDIVFLADSGALFQAVENHTFVFLVVVMMMIVIMLLIYGLGSV